MDKDSISIFLTPPSGHSEIPFHQIKPRPLKIK